jgi:hypothetical protein
MELICSVDCETIGILEDEDDDEHEDDSSNSEFRHRDSLARLHVLRLSEVLAHLHTMSRAPSGQHARIQLKAGHLDQAELRLCMAA